MKDIKIRGQHVAAAGASMLIFAAGAAAQGSANGNGNGGAGGPAVATQNGAGGGGAVNGGSVNGGGTTSGGAVNGGGNGGATSGGATSGGAGNGATMNGGTGGGTANGASGAGATSAPNGGGQSVVALSALTDAPASYFGQNVATAGVVGKVLGPRTFTLKGEDAIQRNSGPNEILVTLTGQLPDVPGRGDTNRLQPGDPVEIWGTFNNYHPVKGDGIFNPHQGVGYQGVPMVTANQISIAGLGPNGPVNNNNNANNANNGGNGGASGGGNSGASGASLSSSPNGGSANGGNAGASANGGGANGGGQVVALSQLIDNPAQYLGKNVTVAGVVGKISGPATITMYGEDAVQKGAAGPNRLRVILATQIPDVPGRPDDARLKPGDPIQVSGVFSNLRTLTGGKAGSNGSKVGYQGAPTLVAHSLGIAALGLNGQQDFGNGSSAPNGG